MIFKKQNQGNLVKASNLDKVRVKLLYITNGINGSGGLERVLSVKASLLAEDFGYEVAILCLNNNHENPFYPFSDKIKTASISVGGNPISYFRTYKKGIQDFVNQFQPDVILVCDDGLKGFFLPQLISTKAKWLYERHASVNLNAASGIKGMLMRIVMRSQIQKFHRFVVLTQGNVKEWNRSNVVVMPNPLSFQTEEISPLNQKRIIAVGSHSYNKGYDMLLDIWEKLSPKHPDWQLDIFGKIDPQKRFIQLSQTQKLQRINFFPPVKDIQSEYLKSSVLVLPSRSEGFGMVLIEAMECGVPCVSFDCPSGPGDIISNGVDGFLVENGNIEDFAQKLETLISNDDLRKTMGKKAKENVKRYAAKEIVKQWDEMFRKLVELNPPQSFNKIN